MIRVTLTDAQRAEIRTRTQAPGITPRLRDRLEMIRLADAGWAIPRIAHYLGRHEQTVRKYIKAFLTDGVDALADRPRPGRPPTVTATHLNALEGLLDAGDRTWTTPQLAAWLAAEYQVQVHPDYLSHLLHTRRFGWKRTVTSVAHKRRDPDGYAAKVAELDELKKSHRRGDRSVVSRSKRLRPDAANGLYLGAPGTAGGGALRGAARATGERGGGVRPP